MLFSRNGYEQTSTAAIAREAGSSESQLIRYFGGKIGVLEAIFNEGWSRVQESMAGVVGDASHGREAIIRVLRMMTEMLGADDDLAFLFLLEGRRIRGNTRDVILSRGFVQFMQGVNALIVRGQEDGSIRSDLPAEVIATALLGAAESMMRERVLAQRHGSANPFDATALSVTFAAMINGLSPHLE